MCRSMAPPSCPPPPEGRNSTPNGPGSQPRAYTAQTGADHGLLVAAVRRGDPPPPRTTPSKADTLLVRRLRAGCRNHVHPGLHRNGTPKGRGRTRIGRAPRAPSPPDTAYEPRVKHLVGRFRSPAYGGARTGRRAVTRGARRLGGKHIVDVFSNDFGGRRPVVAPGPPSRVTFVRGSRGSGCWGSGPHGRVDSMQIGVVYPQIELGGDPTAVGRFGRAVEELGFDYLLAYDHVLGAVHADRTPRLTGPYTERDPFHDPFVMFAYLAGMTERIGFATGVLILPQRQTALVARQAADVICSPAAGCVWGSEWAGAPWSSRPWVRTSVPEAPVRKSRSRCCAGCFPNPSLTSPGVSIGLTELPWCRSRLPGPDLAWRIR